MAARELRTKWLNEMVIKYHFHYYATAHHLDDQMETFFINLIRGTGIAGLRGIFPKQGRLIHPMLFTYRRNIEDFIRSGNLKYREDSSNLSRLYLRNKIRYQVIPVFKELSDGFAEKMTKNIGLIRFAEKFYSEQISKLRSNMVKESDGCSEIDVKMLSGINQSETVMFEILREYNFNHPQVKSIMMAAKSQPGKQFFSDSHRLVTGSEKLLIQSLQYLNAKENIEYLLGNHQQDLVEPFALSVSRFNRAENFSPESDRNTANIDEDKIKYPLKIRRWQKGDRFYPLGMKNMKLLSDFFIDLKLSVPEKENIWIILSEDQVIWIPGLRLDDRYKLTGHTKTILQLKLL
jgi:tRNA(Ile)-lysidine synthase